MPAHDVEALVRGWVADEAQQQSFTDEVGWMVTWDRVEVPTPQGIGLPRPVDDRADHPDRARPPEDAGTGEHHDRRPFRTGRRPVRQGVAAVIEGLRKKRTQLKAPGNGHGPTGLVVKGSG